MPIEERQVNVGGLTTPYLTAGEGPPLVLLHADGNSPHSWRWVMPELARTHRVYVPTFPGAAGDTNKVGVAKVADHSGSSFATFLAAFLDVLGIERAAVVGCSHGGLVALHLALSDPSRVTALGLVDSSGLGRAINPGLAMLTLPGYGEMVIGVQKTPLGAAQRALGRSAFLFTNPARIPPEWLAEQYRLALLPGFLEATLAVMRSQIGPLGQREVLLDELPRLTMPTLVVWGALDLIVPYHHALAAVARLPRGHLALIPDCGHLPHVERPDRFIAALGRFLDDHVG